MSDLPSLPIEWHYPEDIITRFANNIIIQHTESEFILSFFEIRPLLIMGEQEEVEEKLRNVDSIRAECVARIVVPAGRMPGTVKAIQDNLEKYLAKYEGSKE